jgi:hypothetical membrane protein
MEIAPSTLHYSLHSDFNNASPWFNHYNNALSDLGNIAWNGWVAFIYNFGLIFSGFYRSFPLY